MIDNFEPAIDQRAQRMGEFALTFDIVQKVLRTERGFRAAQRKAALTEERVNYWQQRVDEVEKAINALIRMKDIGKLALLETKVSIVEEWAQQPLLDGATSDPKSLGY